VRIKFNLEHVELVPAYLDASGKPLASVIPSIAEQAAKYLDGEPTNTSKLAVSGGRLFVRQIASYLEPRKLESLEVLPSSGFIRALANVGDASLIAYDIATKYEAKYSWLPIPAIVETKDQQQVSMNLPIVRDVRDKVENEADIYLIQFFTPFSKKLITEAIISEEQMKIIKSKNPVFNIELWFYDSNGQCINDTSDDWPYYLTGFDINNLRDKIESGKQVIVVGGANSKHAQAIKLILEKKLANVLITDHITAVDLLK